MKQPIKPAFDQRTNIYNVIGLLVLLAFIIKVLIGFHENAHLRYERNKMVEWMQPVDLNDVRLKPIGNKVWTQELVSVERVLWRAKRNHNNDLLISSETLALLKQASSLVAKDVSTQELDRLSFVLKKSAPDADVLVDLLRAYISYDKEFIAKVQVLNSVSGNEKLQLLRTYRESTERLQERFFGKDNATKLFAEHNAMLNYLNERRIINMSEELSEIQKKEQRLRLKGRYEVSRKLNADLN